MSISATEFWAATAAVVLSVAMPFTFFTKEFRTRVRMLAAPLLGLVTVLILAGFRGNTFGHAIVLFDDAVLIACLAGLMVSLRERKLGTEAASEPEAAYKAGKRIGLVLMLVLALVLVVEYAAGFN